MSNRNELHEKLGIFLNTVKNASNELQIIHKLELTNKQIIEVLRALQTLTEITIFAHKILELEEQRIKEMSEK